MANFRRLITIGHWHTPAKVSMNKSLKDFDAVLRSNPRNALALYARRLTLLKKGDRIAGNTEISAAKAINPNIAE
jgi:hypothetical protein